MGRHVHILSSIDPDALTAECAECGPVGLIKNKDRFRCARGPRKKPPPTRQRRPQPKPSEYHRITDINANLMVGTCSQCGPGARVVHAKTKLHERRYFCYEARRARRVGPTHGLSGEQRDQILAEQGGRCANPACRTDIPGSSGWCVDHNHTTGKIRGVLCHGCNAGIGLLGDTAAKVLGAYVYLLRTDGPEDQ